MDSLSGISMFVQVAETRSFTEAARILGVSASAVGKSIGRLEERLRVRLFHRSTRSITLTAEGALFLERCRRILGELDAAESELSHAAGSPRGKLKVGIPQLNKLFMPVFDSFMQRYPDIDLDIDMSDRMVDVIEEGFDIVVRTGEQHDSRLVVRKMGACAHVLVATPGYLERHGEPRHPSELVRHMCLQHRFPATGKLERWPFLLDESEPDVVLPETMTANTIEPLAYSVLQGRGIAFLPAFLVRDALDNGQLRTVLDDYLDRTVEFRMLWPASRYASPKLRVFIDHLIHHLKI
ncbi:LysR substrate-binding domain-containing protein [Burkholderia plantarii]|uniref:Transcriptional regulator, LysR family n=1 Tax=Burkholderia plantarii TaxID=41899 RepID=A0A0B6S602_BURPL|nr:LysR substrate-binding domain-containing protein [Burkholderia plantarii]AJK49829.1 transcriptional regulator, LysR family [Burkholderia plantarii]ALK34049.1 transcriptional regulator [Burkholderia plantarii]GLZ21479.1 LysR family transcriptional regulator [Burkholderia plantarii]